METRTREEFIRIKYKYQNGNVERHKKRDNKKTAAKLATWRKSNAKEFWKEIKPRNRTEGETEKIGDDEWMEHFMKVVGTPPANLGINQGETI